MVIRAYNISTWKEDQEGQSHLHLYSKFQTSLGWVRPCLGWGWTSLT